MNHPELAAIQDVFKNSSVAITNGKFCCLKIGGLQKIVLVQGVLDDYDHDEEDMEDDVDDVNA